MSNDAFTIEERDYLGKIADELASLIAAFNDYEGDVSQEQMGMMHVARGYMLMYMHLFKNQ